MRYLIIFVLIIAAASCKNKVAYFDIKGRIVHAHGRKLYLKQLAIGNQNPVLIDTTIINGDGSFDMKTFMPFEQDLFVLSIENGPDLYLINDAANIEMYVDVDHYKNYKLEGSAASKQLHSFLETYNEIYKTLVDKINLYDTMQQSNASDSVVLIYKQSKDSALNAINQLVATNIQQSSNPALRSYLLAKAFATMDKETIAKLVGASKAQFKNYGAIDFLNKIIQNEIKSAPPPYPLLDKQAPSFAMEDNFKKMFCLDSMRGKYVLLDFWASYSKPCRETENPNMGKVYKWYRNKGLVMVGVSLDSTLHPWKLAIDNDNLYWRQVCDFEEWGSPIVKKYNVTTLPYNVLIDTTGKVIAANLSGRDLTLKLYDVLPK